MSLRLRIAHDIEKLDNIRSSTEILEDFDLSLDLLLLDWLQYFDYTFLTIFHVHSFKHFAVLSPSHFPHNLVVILVPKSHFEAFIIPIFFWAMLVYISEVSGSTFHLPDSLPCPPGTPIGHGLWVQEKRARMTNEERRSFQRTHKNDILLQIRETFQMKNSNKMKSKKKT